MTQDSEGMEETQGTDPWGLEGSRLHTLVCHVQLPAFQTLGTREQLTVL